MYTGSHTLKKGFTLIELMISMACLIIILTTLFFTFNFYYDTYQSVYSATSTSDNIRFLSVILERQIRSSSTIYILNDRIYVRDMETPGYYNYYTCNNGMIFKIKTDSNLDDIGSGSTSQLGWNVDDFFLSYTEEGNISMYLAKTLDGKTYQVSKEIEVVGKVIIVNH